MERSLPTWPREFVEAALRGKEGKRVQVTWTDAVTQSVMIHSCDEEGFLHSGPDGTEPASVWTRYEDVAAIA